jgi:signal transduction histidine kinase/ActR/RegA family two-component response regulator
MLSLSAFIALAISSVSILIYASSIQKKSSMQTLSILTDIMSENLSAAIDFDDAIGAKTTLNSLVKNENIEAAYIFKKEKNVFASYVKKDIDATKIQSFIDEVLKSKSIKNEFQFIDIDKIVINKKINFQNRTLASILIVENTDRTKNHIQDMLMMILSIFFISLTIITLLAMKLQRYFTTPIFQLNNAMKNVSKNHDYDVNIQHPFQDEFKSMFTSFNHMIKTIRKQNSELIAVNEKTKKLANAKSEFLANMSHEIRTPLNAIMGFVHLLKKEITTKKELEFIHIIDSSSKTLLNIIEDILDYSKIESGKLDINKYDFNVKDEFSIVTSLFDAKAKEKNINLNLTITEDVPDALNTDPLRIKQIISNLLSNAIKFTGEGKSVYVNIDYHEGNLKVSVKDEGIGIAKEKLDHIFESFSQEDSSTTRDYGGTGLGLSISKELVKLLGGQLQVKSEKGKGSEFYFFIPANEGVYVQHKKEDIKSQTFKGSKILLVEDNKPNQMFMKVILKKLEVEFDIANDGVEAVEAFKNKKYDVILMDENMPNMNGILATKHIIDLEKEKNLKHTPIIALTANALKGDKEKFLEAGMDEYLTKPLEKNKLVEMLNKFIN